MKSKKYAVVDSSRCVACGTCMLECPKGAISIIKGCYAFCGSETCVGCGRCAKVCPTGCIAVIERGEAQ